MVMHDSVAPADRVVLCPINMTAGAILHVVQTLTFTPAEMTIGGCPMIGTVDTTLFLFQSSGFRSYDFTATDPLANSLFLSMISDT